MPKRRYNKRKPLTKQQYKQVAKIANKQIHKQSELKVVDANFSTAVAVAPADGATGIRQRLSLNTQGDSRSQREGDSIYLKNLSIRGWVDNGSSTNILIYRMILVQWLEFDDSTDGRPPELGDILRNPDGSTNSMYPINSPYVTHPVYSFKILDDRTYAWDSNNASAPKPYRVNISAKDLGRRKINFEANGADCNGNIYLFHFADQTSTGAGMTDCDYRVRYFDN